MIKNQLNRTFCTTLLVIIGAVYSSGGHAMMSIFDGFPTEEECRNCHEDLERFPQLERVNPDRHHRLVGTPIPYPDRSKAPDAPGGTPGEPYECTACHEFFWDDIAMNYVIKPFRDCLQCHPVYLVTGNPMRGSNVHHQTETFRQRNCRACHGRGMGGGGMGGGGMGGGGMGGGGMGGGGMGRGGMGGRWNR